MPQFLKLLKFFLLINASLHIKKEDLPNIKNLYLCCFVMMHLTFSLPSTILIFHLLTPHISIFIAILLPSIVNFSTDNRNNFVI